MNRDVEMVWSKHKRRMTRTDTDARTAWFITHCSQQTVLLVVHLLHSELVNHNELLST